MDEFKLYVVSLRYIEYLRQYEPTKILSSIGDHYVHDRKYLGIVYSIGGYNFFAPSYNVKPQITIFRDFFDRLPQKIRVNGDGYRCIKC